MKIYIVVRCWYNDGDYEDYYEGENEYCGVYQSIEKARETIKQLIDSQEGTQGYLCGGVVRHELNGDFGTDWDIASKAIDEVSVRFYDKYDGSFTEYYYILETELEEL